MGHKFSPWPILDMLKPVIVAVLVSIPLFFFRSAISDFFLPILGVVWIITILLVLSAYGRSRFYVINLKERSIVHKTGFLSQRRVVIPYVEVTQANYEQSLAQRICQIGNLVVESAGGDRTAIYMQDVEIHDLKKIVSEINEKAREQDYKNREDQDRRDRKRRQGGDQDKRERPEYDPDKNFRGEDY